MLLGCVAELFDDGRSFRPLHERDECFSRFVVGTIAEQNRILADRGIQIGWDDPARTFQLLDDLREGYEPKLGVAGVDELEGLRDAAALYDLAAESVVNIERLHRFQGRCAVGSRRRIRHGDFVEFCVTQCLIAFHQIAILAEQHDLADSIRKQRVANSQLFSDQLLRRGVVRRQEYLERRGLRNLCIELACRAEA